MNDDYIVLLKKHKTILSGEIGIPLYSQVEYIIINLIDNQKLPAGTEFVSEEELSALLGVSRPTINKAVKSLIEKGYLTRERGKRAIVKNPNDLPLVFLGELISFGEMLEKQKVKYYTELLERSIITPSGELRRKLQLTDDEDVVFLKRRRFVEEEPILIVDSYFSKNKYEAIMEIPAHRFNGNLYHLMQEYFNTNMVSAEREVFASRVDFDDAMLLNSSLWEPCLLLRAVNYTENQVPVEMFTSRLKGNRCVLKTDLKSKR